MLLSTRQLSLHHNFPPHSLNLSAGGKSLERVKTNQAAWCPWAKHVKSIASSCYGTLASLKKIKNVTSFSLKAFGREPCSTSTQLLWHCILSSNTASVKETTVHTILSCKFCDRTLCGQCWFCGQAGVATHAQVLWLAFKVKSKVTIFNVNNS